MVGSNPVRGFRDFFWECQVLYTGYLIGSNVIMLLYSCFDECDISKRVQFSSRSPTRTSSFKHFQHI